ncbi:MAG: hypothetical protein A2046_15335 [Bacteroidetes bacterium GWA2_30_7]|nr:MAG: hypothetical protein A2046_15335 [Bacteroidetes bacterium GWA2_30_7]
MNIDCCEFCNAKNYTAAKVLNNNELGELQKNTVRLQLGEGVEVFKQNTESANVYYLNEGIVKLTMFGIHRDKIIKIINSPNYIGLAATLGSNVFGFSAITITQSSVCVTKKETYNNLISNNSAFSIEIIKHLSNNELNQYNTCVCLLQQNLTGRVASCLLNYSRNIYKKEKFNINRKDISDIIGQTRENISRVMSQFTKDGIINIVGNEITVLDINRLEEISKIG